LKQLHSNSHVSYVDVKAKHVYIVIFALSFALAMIFDVFLNHVSQKKSDRAEESAFIWIRKGRATSQHFSRNKVKH